MFFYMQPSCSPLGWFALFIKLCGYSAKDIEVSKGVLKA